MNSPNLFPSTPTIEVMSFGAQSRVVRNHGTWHETLQSFEGDGARMKAEEWMKGYLASLSTEATP